MVNADNENIILGACVRRVNKMLHIMCKTRASYMVKKERAAIRKHKPLLSLLSPPPSHLVARYCKAV